MQPPAPIPDAASDVPLAVDLDGTLVRTDTLHENLLVLLKHAPWLLLLVPLWVLRGKAFFKAEVARRALLDVTSLPYNAEVLAFLREEHARGRRLVLATAADRSIADAVASHLGLFDTVVASEAGVNLSGARKLERLRQVLGTFDYAGNDAVDLALWRECRQVIVVHAPAGVLRQAQGLGRPVHRVFESPPGGVRPWVKALRVHQWAKNALVFVPVLAAHKATQGGMAPRAVLAFIAFSLCASAVYVINDLLDLASDRRHPSKSQRPFASGALPVRAGVVLAPLLLAGATALALTTLPLSFFALLAAYFVLTLAYSLRLKQVVMLDVLVLAGLYTVRIFGGALAVGVPTSSWLLMFSTFLFLSLALLKRLSEVRRLRQSNETSAHGRGYLAQDYEQLSSLGTAAGQVSVLVLALYITSKEVTALYAHPERLWLLCPVMLYWVGRIWVLAHRGLVNEDPLIFALRDRVSYVVGVVAALVLWVAT
ncbi:UbiA family prenyltransferase [Corallococcus aberystwythensis]|uniref:UbiA family prenyltransferase n=1 Tax=Corallococcus aberystwythensis TaxID=2316722 RepID=A0A3A8PNQ5_9BACT|nr:UbiA family prenyltransferase [Corallococcus aberystwythensis]RKH58006.1 UbiA family prenyltransferase [Corallococcus aberystwythensis]